MRKLGVGSAISGCRRHMRRQLRTHQAAISRAARIVAAACLLAVASACGGGNDDSASSASALPGEGKPAVTLGTKDFLEQFILGELYAQALEARGYTVNLKKNIGATEVVDDALTEGEIDAYPEYLGVAVAVVAGDTEPLSSDEETYERAKEFYESRGEAISEQTPFSNVDAIATTADFAEENDLGSIADLAGLEGVRLGARPEFADRFQGLRGMREVYGLMDVEFVGLAQGTAYGALDDGTVDAINVFTTDPQLRHGAYAVLDDPENIFGFQHVALVVDREKLEALGGDEFMAVVNKVNEVLTDDAISEMNEAVFLDEQPEDEVARAFLERNGLLETS
jgi:osmoprotectant transport system substrate-binding protein